MNTAFNGIQQLGVGAKKKGLKIRLSGTGKILKGLRELNRRVKEDSLDCARIQEGTKRTGGLKS